MNRWTPTRPAPPSQRWQSREEILKAHLDSLSPDELRRARPDYYWLRFGQKAWIRDYTRKYDPNQPRVPAGNADGGQWTTEAGDVTGSMSLQPAPYLLAAGRPSVTYCMHQNAIDMLYCSALQPAWYRAACRAQANERLGACLAGKPLPPLPF